MIDLLKLIYPGHLREGGSPRTKIVLTLVWLTFKYCMYLCGNKSCYVLPPTWISSEQKPPFWPWLGLFYYHEIFDSHFYDLKRFSLFFACRKYLLRILYSNLATLSTPAVSGTHNNALSRSSTPGLDDASIELETLPPPTTQTPRSSHFVIKDPTYLHTSISRAIFSWCFAESCMLFLLLMLQGWGLFSRSVHLHILILI